MAILPRNASACQLSISVLPDPGPAKCKQETAFRGMKMLRKVPFRFSFPWALFFHAFSTRGLIKSKVLLLFLLCHYKALGRNTRMQMLTLLPGGREDRAPMGEEIIATFW